MLYRDFIPSPDVEHLLLKKDAMTKQLVSLVSHCAAAVNAAHVFLNARNAAVVPRDIRKKTKGGRRKQKKQPAVTWHDIVVTRGVVKDGESKIVTPAEVDHVLSKEHLARGHWKDYTQGAGLFGRYKGRFWWSPHLRGSREHGKVEKSYTLKQDD